MAELQQVGSQLRQHNWLLQPAAGLDLIPGNDFSYYGQVLDMSLLVGAMPARYTPISQQNRQATKQELYFDMVLTCARALVPLDHLWVNPDCGLKTRRWPKTEAALRQMVQAAHEVRAAVAAPTSA